MSYQARVATLEEFRESRERWNELALQMKRPSVFCTWEWIYTWWEHFGALYEPVIIFFFQADRLIGILPLASRSMVVEGGVVSGRVLSFCGSQELYSDHIDVICDERHAAQCIEEFFKFIRMAYRSWDVIHLSHLPEASKLVGVLNKEGLDLDLHIRKVSVAPYCVITGKFDDYWAAMMDRKQRYNIRAGEKKLKEKFGVQYVSSDAHKVEDDLRELFRLHELRANQKRIKSTFCGSALFSYHRALCQRLVDAGWLWLRLLRNGEIVIAAFYGFVFGERLFFYQLGLDPLWDKYSPGTVLIQSAMAEAFGAGLIEFDFLRGNEGYKSRWVTETRSLYTVDIYNATTRGATIKMIEQVRVLLKKFLRPHIQD